MTTTETAPLQYGRIANEPIESYHSSGCVSKTRIDTFRRSPRLFQKLHITHELTKDEPSEALILGSGIDALALDGPDEFNRRFAAIPADAPKRPTKAQLNAKKPSPASEDAMAWWDEWTCRTHGKQTLSAEQMEIVNRCAEALQANEVFSTFRRTSVPQLTFRLAGDLFPVQCRPDLWCEEGNALTKGEPTIFDLKTIAELPDDDPDFLSRHIAKFGYHRGAWWYSEVLSAVMKFGDFRPKFVLCFVEKQEPFAVVSRVVDDVSVGVGEKEVRAALANMKKCYAMPPGQKWPETWVEPMVNVGLPGWYLKKALEGTGDTLWG
jgi:hypothetical protein